MLFRVLSKLFARSMRRRPRRRAAGTSTPEEFDPWLRIPKRERIDLLRESDGRNDEPWDDIESMDATAIAALILNNPSSWQLLILKGLAEHGLRFARYLTLAGKVSDELAPLSAMSSRYLPEWFQGRLLTDSVTELEARAGFMLALLEETPSFVSKAASAMLALPPGNALRNEARITAALQSVLAGAVNAAGELGADWELQASLFLTAIAGLVEHRLGSASRLEQLVQAALRVMRSSYDDPAVARMEIARYLRGRAAGASGRGEYELADQLNVEASALWTELKSTETDLTRQALFELLATNATGNEADAVRVLKRLDTSAGDTPLDFAAGALANSVLGKQAQASGDDQQTLARLLPTLDDLERQYLSAVLEADVSTTGQALASTLSRVADSFARQQRFGDCIQVIDRAKSLRLRYQAGLRVGRYGPALRNLESEIYAWERGVAPKTRFSPSMTDRLDQLRAFQKAGYDTLRPSLRVQEIASVLGAREAVVILGNVPSGVMLSVILAGDQDEPTHAELLPPEQASEIIFTFVHPNVGWWWYLGFGPAFVEPHGAMAVMLDAIERYVGRPVAATLSASEVDTVIVVPHLLLHLVPYWALPSLSPYRVMTAPSAAQFVASRRDEPSVILRALVVGNPTGDLQLAESEAECVGAVLHDRGFDVTLRCGSEATKSELTDKAMGCGLLHFSGHGMSDLLSPLRSALEVHPDPAVDMSDGTDLLATLAAKATWEPVDKFVVSDWVRSNVESRARIDGYGWLEERIYPSTGRRQLRLERGPRSTVLARYGLTEDTDGPTDPFAERARVAELWSAGDIMTDQALVSCRLAFLSACEAGHGQGQPVVDEFAGLPAALELAGVRTVVSPMWSVSVELAFVFAETFYEALVAASEQFDVLIAIDTARHRVRTMTGTDAARILGRLRGRMTDPLGLMNLDVSIEALRTAELPFAHPCDWAAFSVSGAPTVRLTSQHKPARPNPSPIEDRRIDLPPISVPLWTAGLHLIFDVFIAAHSAERYAEASDDPAIHRYAADRLTERGRAYLRQDSTDDARRDFARAAELDPSNTDSRVELTRLAGGGSSDLLRQYDEILDIDPHATTAILLRAEVLMDLGQLDMAKQQLDELLDSDPEESPTAHALADRAKVYEQMGDVNAALDDVTKALAIHPELPRLYLLRSRLNLARSEHAPAWADASRAAFLAPADPEPLLLRGHIEILRGAPAAALGDFEQAITIDPNNVPARYNRICAWSLVRIEETRILPELRWLLRQDPALHDEAMADDNLEWARSNLADVASLLGPQSDSPEMST